MERAANERRVRWPVLPVVSSCLVLLLWGRSCTTQDYVMRQGNNREIGLRSRWGLLYLQVGRSITGPQGATWVILQTPVDRSYAPINDTDLQYGILDFGWWRAAPGSFWQGTDFFTVPYWFFVAAAWLAPLRRYVRAKRQERRRDEGLCVACGYNLRGGHERCPECGRMITAT